MQNTQRQSNVNERRGAAALEAAICLPILISLVFASIEASNGIFVKQSVTIAAYEAAKAAAAPRGTKEDALARCQEVLESRDIGIFRVSFSPRNLSSSTPRGKDIKVMVRVTARSSVLGPLQVFGRKTFRKTVTMRRL